MRLFFFANWTDEKTKAAVSVVDEGDAARSAFEGRESSAIGRGVPLISGRRVALTAKRRLRGAAYIHLAWVRRACPRIRFQGPSAGFVFFCLRSCGCAICVCIDVSNKVSTHLSPRGATSSCFAEFCYFSFRFNVRT